MSNASDGAAVRKVTQDWTRAIGDKNAAAMSRVFAEDVATFDLAPPLKQTGFDRKVLEGWFKTWDGPIGMS